GGAYVPLDPTYPRERLDHMLADAEIAVLVTGGAAASQLPATAIPTLRVDGDATRIAAASEGRPRAMGRPEHPAYLIYTSGSTGRPKAVVIEHRSVVNLAMALQRRIYPVTGRRESDLQQRVALNAPLSFDASVQQWSRLLFGDALILL